jgi:hypothetical protein
VKEKNERTQVADEDQFWILASDFEGYRSGRIEEGLSDLGRTGSRSKWR